MGKWIRKKRQRKAKPQPTNAPRHEPSGINYRKIKHPTTLTCVFKWRSMAVEISGWGKDGHTAMSKCVANFKDWVQTRLKLSNRQRKALPSPELDYIKTAVSGSGEVDRYGSVIHSGKASLKYHNETMAIDPRRIDTSSHVPKARDGITADQTVKPVDPKTRLPLTLCKTISLENAYMVFVDGEIENKKTGELEEGMVYVGIKVKFTNGMVVFYKPEVWDKDDDGNKVRLRRPEMFSVTYANGKKHDSDRMTKGMMTLSEFERHYSSLVEDTFMGIAFAQEK